MPIWRTSTRPPDRAACEGSPSRCPMSTNRASDYVSLTPLRGGDVAVYAHVDHVSFALPSGEADGLALSLATAFPGLRRGGEPGTRRNAPQWDLGPRRRRRVRHPRSTRARWYLRQLAEPHAAGRSAAAR